MENVKKIMLISSDTRLTDVLQFCFDGWGYEVFSWKNYESDINLIKKKSPDIIIVDIQSARHADLKICASLKGDPLTAFIPVITLINKRHLRSHLLNLKYGVDDYLIKPPDPLDLRVRIEMAIRRSQFSFYASPLTGIPGGRIIEETLKEKIKSKLPFSFGYVDIDNFKSFNDEYGYLKGDRVIMHTAYLLYSTIKKFGNPEDFTGHIGGDDFAFITTPDKHEAVCRNFISSFDKVTPFHYSAKDRGCKFVMARDRNNTVRKTPLMSLSVAVVNKQQPSEIKSIIEINEQIAEIKKYLKNIPGSKFMADRRNRQTGENNKPCVNTAESINPVCYKPLGQILIERNVISDEQLDEALRIHWRRGIVFGEAVRELGYAKEEEIADALNTQDICLTQPTNALPA